MYKLDARQDDNSVLSLPTNQSGGSQTVQLGTKKALLPYTLDAQAAASPWLYVVVLAVVAVTVWLILRRK